MGLTNNFEDGDTCNALILPGNHKSTNKKKKQVNNSRKKNLSCLSKSQQRKLKRLQEEKDKRAMRSDALDSLEKYRLRDDAYALLLSSGSIGQAETMRGKLSRAMQLHRAGLEVPADIPLFRERVVDQALETESCATIVFSAKCNMKKDMQETGEMQTKKRKQVAFHACDSARFTKRISKPHDKYEDATKVAFCDVKGKVESELPAEGPYIGWRDTSLENHPGPSICCSQERFMNGVVQGKCLTSMEQGPLVTNVSCLGSYSDKALTLSLPLGYDQRDAASIRSTDDNSQQNFGQNHSIDTTQERKQQVHSSQPQMTRKMGSKNIEHIL